MRSKPHYCLLAILFTCAALTSQAQLISIHAGATTSMNATFVLDKGLSEDPRYSSTATYKWSPVGFHFGIDLAKKFGLSLESILSKQGQIYDMVNTAKEVAGTRKIDMTMINLPMLMKFMSGGSSAVRGNFNFGPQLSLLTDAVETIQANAGTYDIPEGVTIESIREELAPGAEYEQYINVDPNDASKYIISQNLPEKDLLTKKANDFKNAQFQIAAAFGLDLDLSKHLYLSMQGRATYSLTDMRNGDVIAQLKTDAGSIFGNRAQLAVGMQLGLHYVFGKTRSHRE